MRICLFLLFLVSGYVADAQSFFAMRRARTLIFTAGTGTASYFGELKNPKDYIDAKPNLNLGLQLFLNQRISIRSEITWYQLSGSDAEATDDRKQRNLSFRSNNYEINVSGLYSLTPQGKRYYQRPGANLYVFAGIGMTYINPKAYYQGEWVALQPLMTEGKSYSKIQPVVPFGMGLRIKRGPFFNICIEGGYRLTFTDYLDDASSTRYADPATLSSDLSRALADRRAEYFAGLGQTFTPKPNVGKRGNPESNDGYFLLNVKLEYYLPYQIMSQNSQKKTFKSKRKAFYRYNKRGGLRKK